jgi:hypothetical protein
MLLIENENEHLRKLIIYESLFYFSRPALRTELIPSPYQLGFNLLKAISLSHAC